MHSLDVVIIPRQKDNEIDSELLPSLLGQVSAFFDIFIWLCFGTCFSSLNCVDIYHLLSFLLRFFFGLECFYSHLGFPKVADINMFNLPGFT